MTDRVWVLGASDPEMEGIERVLRDCGETVVHATMPDGQRVRPETAYRCPVPEVPEGATVYAVECIDVLPEGWVRIDHHRPGDPGYGRPPAEFLAASSIGQVIAELARLCVLRRRWTGTQYLGVCWAEHVEDGIGENLEQGDIVFGRWGYHTDGVDGLEYGTEPDAEGPNWVVGSWWANYRGVVIPDDIVYIAAADHCLAAAYRGECPGVEPDALMRWRAGCRAKFQGRPVEAVLADVERARAALREAPVVSMAEGIHARDLRGPAIPELPEAAAREGECFLASLRERDGKTKIVCQSGTPEQIAAFMHTWAPAQGLVDIYGDPARGFAGGYMPPGME